MKAILIIDMPNRCCECKLFWNDVDCGCMALGRALGEFGCSVGKPVDCPLKPIPEKKMVTLFGLILILVMKVISTVGMIVSMKY